MHLRKLTLPFGYCFVWPLISIGLFQPLSGQAEFNFSENVSYHLSLNEPIEESNSPSITVLGEAPVEIKWFFGEPDLNYQHGDPIPEESILLREEIRTEPSFKEEWQTYFTFDLSGVVLETFDTLWVAVHATNGSSIQVLQSQLGNSGSGGTSGSGGSSSIPSGLSWGRTSEGGYLRGTDFREGRFVPFLDFSGGGDAEVVFYTGEPGDTSNLHHVCREILRAPGSYSQTAFFREHTQTDTVQIWARVTIGDQSADSPPLVLKTVEPEEVSFVDWTSSYAEFDAGAEFRVKPSFNVPVRGAMNAEIYWGESGDTSELFGTVTPEDVPVIKLVVPPEPRYFWIRLRYGDLVLDSPTAAVIPLEESVPVVIDQPDNFIRQNAYGSIPGYPIGVVGGNINILWYAGEPGDFSKPITAKFSPNSFGNVRRMDITIPPDADQFYALIWNDQGTTVSRAVQILDESTVQPIFTTVPFRVRLTEADYLQAIGEGPEFALFAVSTSYYRHEIDLMRKSGETFVLEMEGRTGWSHSLQRRYFDYYKSKDDYFALKAPFLPSGTYRYRVNHGGSQLYSPPFELINELKGDAPVNTPPAVYPLVPAGLYSNGGGFKAILHATRFLDDRTFKVYAGKVGDRSRTIDFQTSYPTGLAELYPDFNYGVREFSIEWIADGSGLYWFEGSTLEGETVRSVLRYPDAFGADFGDFENILVPPGANQVPIPELNSLPDVADWRFGGEGLSGSSINLPFGIDSFLRQKPEITLWSKDNLLVDDLSISVDPTVPPQNLHHSTQVAVLPDGRILWVGPVNGDLSGMRVEVSTDGDVWEEVIDTSVKAESGVVIPEGSAWLKTVLSLDDRSTEDVFEINSIDEDFLPNTEALKSERDNIITERMGSFLNLSTYPLVRHAELGWMVVHPYESGLLFFGETVPGKGDWNWTHPEIFPSILNLRTGEWKHYWINGYGWIYDYNSEIWSNLNPS